MATAIANVGVVLKFEDESTILINEGDLVTNLVYKQGKNEVTVTGTARVICARTVNYNSGPTECPPEPYLFNYIKPTMIIIDSSDEYNAQINRINISDIVSVESVAEPSDEPADPDDPNNPDEPELPEVSIGGADSEYADLQSAIDAIESGKLVGKLSLADDVAVEKTLVVKGDVTVNLNGHTISGPASEGNKAYAHVFYVDGGNLTIDGEGEIQCGSYQSYAVFNAGPADTWTPDKSPAVGGGVGTVTINGGKFVQTSTDKAHMGYLIVNHGAEMTINGGDFSMAFGWSSLICNGFQGTPTLSPKMTINGGTFKGGRHTINNDHAGRMTITGGEFQMGEKWDVTDGTGPKNVLRNEADSFVTVSGGKFTGDVQNDNTAANAVKVTGGTFSADVSDYLPAGYRQDASGEVYKA